MPGEEPRAVVVSRGLRRVEEVVEGAGVSEGVQERPSAVARSLSRYWAAKWVLYCRGRRTSAVD